MQIKHEQVKPIFIIGAYRSGTSALTWCLGQHPNILTLEETHWIARQSVDLDYLYRLGINKGQHSSLGVMQITKRDFYQYYGEVIDGLISQNKSLIIKNGMRILESHGLLRDGNYNMCRSSTDPKLRWVDGTPENSFYVYGLMRLFPCAKFVHILRRPTQVASSLMHFSSAGGRDYGDQEAYLTWKRIVEACVDAEKALGGKKSLRIYYDDLLSRPEFVIRSCLDFIQEPFNSDCLLPLKHKINSSGIEHEDESLQPGVALDAIQYYELLTRELQCPANISALKSLARKFYGYCFTQTPQHLEGLSNWASHLAIENERMRTEIKSLGNIVSRSMEVISCGPEEIYAGEPFNTQPNGESAIWVTAKNATSDSVIVLADNVLASSPHSDGSIITANVPRHLYCRPGEFQLYLKDASSGAESNRITLRVLSKDADVGY